MDARERRVKTRYPIELKVRYQATGTAGPANGVGQTVNMSSSGMFLACSSHIVEGSRIKLFVEWPSLLNGTTPLQLITVGTVVRCAREGISVAFEGYQFRTMSRARHPNVVEVPRPVMPSYGDTRSPALSLLAKSSA